MSAPNGCLDTEAGGSVPVRGVRILFVCLGNICRSPSAEAVMRAKVAEAGLQGQIELDSAGTGSWHVGEPPDGRAGEAAHARGIELRGVARQVSPRDLGEFDLILAMDRANLRALERLAPDVKPRAELRLLREFEPGASGRGGVALDVPDPYYGGSDGFDRVLDLLDTACAGLLVQLRRELAAREPGEESERASKARG
jgi:protein-tyrosine phosphatase